MEEEDSVKQEVITSEFCQRVQEQLDRRGLHLKVSVFDMKNPPTNLIDWQKDPVILRTDPMFGTPVASRGIVLESSLENPRSYWKQRLVFAAYYLV